MTRDEQILQALRTSLITEVKKLEAHMHAVHLGRMSRREALYTCLKDLAQILPFYHDAGKGFGDD